MDEVYISYEIIEAISGWVLIITAFMCLAIPFVIKILVESNPKGALEWEALKEAFKAAWVKGREYLSRYSLSWDF